MQGDNGEAGLLSDEERIEVIRLTRQTLDEQGFPNIPVIAGASAPSVRGTIKLCTDASEAGAAFVLVLAPVAWPRKPTTEDAIESYSQVCTPPTLLRYYIDGPCCIGRRCLTRPSHHLQLPPSSRRIQPRLRRHHPSSPTPQHRRSQTRRRRNG